MVVGALSLLAAVVWVQTRPTLEEVSMAVGLAVLAATACALAARWAGRGRAGLRILAIALCVMAAGAAWTGWRAQRQLDALALPTRAPTEYHLTGTVVSIPERGADRVQFDFAPEGAPPGALPRRVRLSAYQAGLQPRAGERWALRVRLRAAQGFANPGGFDYEGWLFRAGVGAVGYVRPCECNRRLAPAGWRRPVLRVRAALHDRIERALEPTPARGVLIGLAVGVTHAIQPGQWQVFRATGLTHLIAISGLHVTMIAALGMWLTRLVWRLPGWGVPRRARSDVAAAVGAACAVGYALLAGFSVPTQRTLIMFLVALTALWRRRAQPPAHIFSLALIAVLLFDPHAALAPGFWLSFLAVAAILWVATRADSPRWRVREFCTVQAAVTVVLLPATVVLFGGCSTVAPLVNLLAIPFFSLWLVPGVLLGAALISVVPPAGAALLTLMSRSFAAFWPALEFAAQLPWAWVALPAPGPVAIAALAASAAVAVTPLPWALRALGALAVLPLLFPALQRPPQGGFHLITLDVGQGLAVVVRTRGHVLLFDAGPGWRSGQSAGERAVVPFLWHVGVRRLDRLVISHPDADHAGGAAAVLRAMQVGALDFGGSLPAGLRTGAAGAFISPCRAGERWVWDGVEFQFLHPGADERWRRNDGSCVLSVVGPGGSALLTGDVEREAEARLVQSGRLKRTDIVLLPHHGSLSSSTPEFVAAVGAGYAIASAGAHNRWGLPHPAVVRRWCAAGAQVLSTAQWGAVSIVVDPRAGTARPRAYRAEHRRYWHAATALDRELCAKDAAASARAGIIPAASGSPKRYVGNHQSRRPAHVADPDLLDRRRRHHSRTAVDSAGQARAAAGAHRPGVEVDRTRPGERQADLRAGAELPARQGSGRGSHEPLPPA